jgi:hypothetical protein
MYLYWLFRTALDFLDLVPVQCSELPSGDLLPSGRRKDKGFSQHYKGDRLGRIRSFRFIIDEFLDSTLLGKK